MRPVTKLQYSQSHSSTEKINKDRDNQGYCKNPWGQLTSVAQQVTTYQSRMEQAGTFSAFHTTVPRVYYTVGTTHKRSYSVLARDLSRSHLLLAAAGRVLVLSHLTYVLGTELPTRTTSCQTKHCSSCAAWRSAYE